jgi:thioredoxin reductase
MSSFLDFCQTAKVEQSQQLSCAAVEEVDFIRKFAIKIIMVHQFDAFTENRQAQEKLFANPKISLWFEHEPRTYYREGEKFITEAEDLKPRTKIGKKALSSGSGVTSYNYPHNF